MAKTLNDEYKTRLEKLKKLRDNGVNPYPEKFNKLQLISEVLNFSEGQKVSTAGRILTIREMGKICFCHILDGTGKMQIVLKEGEISLKDFLKTFDPADFIGIDGELFKTQKGETSILVKKYVLLGKALRPLPEKFHGLQDQEAKYRQRYLDLISNPETYKRFLFRSQFIRLLREFFLVE